MVTRRPDKAKGFRNNDGTQPTRSATAARATRPATAMMIRELASWVATRALALRFRMECSPQISSDSNMAWIVAAIKGSENILHRLNCVSSGLTCETLVFPVQEIPR